MKDEDDFDKKALTIMFPPDEDEASPITRVPASIPIVDDEVDEAREQVFIVYMEVLNATNRELLITDEQNVSICTIIDNDRKCTAFQCWFSVFPYKEQALLLSLEI